MPLDSAKLQELLSILTAEVALVEAGARNSKTDLTHIQAIHDAAGKLGAACDAKEEMGEAAKFQSVSLKETVSLIEGRS